MGKSRSPCIQKWSKEKNLNLSVYEVIIIISNNNFIKFHKHFKQNHTFNTYKKLHTLNICKTKRFTKLKVR